MTIVLILLLVLVVVFGLVVLIGAPYLPTMSSQAKVAFELLDLKKGEVLYELGCGDGKMLIMAAKHGVRSVGVEINPILAFICWARTRRYRELVTVKWANFWTTKLDEADGVFVFLHTRFMHRLHKKIINECKVKPVKLVSYAFRIPEKSLSDEKQGMLLYLYN